MSDPTDKEIEEVMARVRKLELKARRLVRESFSGEYQSSFRGQGLDFDDFREYQHGDEIRFIDWNVTARMNSPFVRKFREERELAVILAVDVSGSADYGSVSLSKREVAAETAALNAKLTKGISNLTNMTDDDIDIGSTPKDVIFEQDRRVGREPPKGRRQQCQHQQGDGDAKGGGQGRVRRAAGSGPVRVGMTSPAASQ